MVYEKVITVKPSGKIYNPKNRVIEINKDSNKFYRMHKKIIRNTPEEVLERVNKKKELKEESLNWYNNKLKELNNITLFVKDFLIRLENIQNDPKPNYSRIIYLYK